MALGHPKGLFPLFFIEMWERLAFYTLLNVLLLYTTDFERGGLGLSSAEGNEIYATLCAGCHMPDGGGAVGAGMYPALKGNEKLEYPDYAVFIVTNGYKAMPPFGHTLSDAQIAAVVNYLQSGLNSYEPAATAEQVGLSRPQ